ncbi:MAG: 50S ribosomal protein L23 [Planctomycetota bacterium]
MDPYLVIRRPVYTEKAHAYVEENDTYVFDVHADANKEEIRKAVEALWSVKVRNVRTLRVPAKPKNYRLRKRGYTRTWKKAFVRLIKGQAIDALK